MELAGDEAVMLWHFLQVQSRLSECSLCFDLREGGPSVFRVMTHSMHVQHILTVKVWWNNANGQCST